MIRRAVSSPLRWVVGDTHKSITHLDTSVAVPSLEIDNDDGRIDVANECDVSSVEEERVEEEDDVVVEEDDELLLLANQWTEFNVTSLRYEDIDYTLTEMPPPSISELGSPFIRVYKAPQNSRRIYAGIDIPASIEEIWNLLTDYEHLQKVVPNLVANEVLELLTGEKGNVSTNSTSVLDGGKHSNAATKCKMMANQMNGSIMKQTGGSKVFGINFTAKMTLEVREWSNGMPTCVKEKGDELERYVFATPFTIPSLPYKDISMQSLEKDNGDFRMYQGVWRLQPLPGCSLQQGESAMRLAYAVEVSPRAYLPVALIEGYIARDLAVNLEAIREVFIG